ncbi:hypothetical protein KEM55_002278, partial [Ascosphaera atra]
TSTIARISSHFRINDLVHIQAIPNFQGYTVEFLTAVPEAAELEDAGDPPVRELNYSTFYMLISSSSLPPPLSSRRTTQAPSPLHQKQKQARNRHFIPSKRNGTHTSRSALELAGWRPSCGNVGFWCGFERVRQLASEMVVYLSPLTTAPGRTQSGPAWSAGFDWEDGGAAVDPGFDMDENGVVSEKQDPIQLSGSHATR